MAGVPGVLGWAPQGAQFSSADCRFQVALSVIGLRSMLQDQGGGGAAWATRVVAFAVFFISYSVLG